MLTLAEKILSSWIVRTPIGKKPNIGLQIVCK